MTAENQEVYFVFKRKTWIFDIVNRRLVSIIRLSEKVYVRELENK
jgi:hypothetical protein